MPAMKLEHSDHEDGDAQRTYKRIREDLVVVNVIGELYGQRPAKTYWHYEHSI
jgi:hypothetical protein